MPIQRPKPPFLQIADLLRDLIARGELKDATGASTDRLASIPEIAEAMGVSRATAHKAVQVLQGEGVVFSNNQGTFVVASGRRAQSAQDQVNATELPAGQREEVRAAGLVACPEYVAGLLGIEPTRALQVIRRESITYDISDLSNPNPFRLSVVWIRAEFAQTVPRLLEPVPGNPVAWIRAATGRRPRFGLDQLKSRRVDGDWTPASGLPPDREAKALHVEAGAPVLAVGYTYSDKVGVVLYGEIVHEEGRVVTYAYTINS